MEESEAKFFEELAGVTREGRTTRVEETPEVAIPEEADKEILAAPEAGEEAVLAKATMGSASRTRTLARKQERAIHKDEEGPEGQLTIDVYQTPTEIVIESAIAGVKPEDIDISVSNDSVAIRGARHRERQVKDTDYLYQECYWGRFSRSVILPEEVDAEQASVDFKNGILVVHLPKMNRQKTKKLKITNDS